MDEILGPLSVLYSWHSLLLAFVLAALTHVIKGALDTHLGGSAERQKQLWANRVVLPLTPIVLGALGGALVPLHPEALTMYLAEHALEGWRRYLVLALYGAAVGQFSDYVWHRFSGLAGDVRSRKNKRKGSVRLPDHFTAASPLSAPPGIAGDLDFSYQRQPAKPAFKHPDNLVIAQASAPSAPPATENFTPDSAPRSTPSEPPTPDSDARSTPSEPSSPRRRRSAFRR